MRNHLSKLHKSKKNKKKTSYSTRPLLSLPPSLFLLKLYPSQYN